MAGFWDALSTIFTSEAVVGALVSGGAQVGAAAYAGHEAKGAARDTRRLQEEQQKLDDAAAAFQTGKAKAQANKDLRVRVALLHSNLAGRGVGTGSSAYLSTTAAKSSTAGVLDDITTQEDFNAQQSDINKSVFAADEKATGSAADANTIGTAIGGIGSLGVASYETAVSEGII